MVSERIRIERQERVRSVLGAVLPGGMTAAAQCVPALFFLAFFGPLFLLLTLLRASGKKKGRYRRSFGLGALFGAVYSAGCYHWLWYLLRADWLSFGTVLRVLVIFGASAALAVLSALLFGGWAVLVTLFSVRAKKKSLRFVVPIAAGGGWMLVEFLQSVTVRWFPVLGLPWIRLAGAFAPRPVLLQSAAVWGSLGVGGFFVFCASLIAAGIYYGKETRTRAIPVGLSFLLLFACIGAGELRLTFPNASGISVSVSLIQGNLGAADKWSAEGASLAWERYSTLTADAEPADLTVWTESAVPVTIERSEELDRALRTLAYDCDTSLLAGLFHRADGKVYNSVYAYRPDGTRTEEPYSKRYPVPFGEYMPLPEIVGTAFPALSSLNVLRDPISRGESAEPLDTGNGKAGVLVCFDCAYPEAARSETARGAEYLCILSNSAWFFDSAACGQAVSLGVLRALECGRDTVLCSSTGISAVIDEKGRVLCESEPLETGVLRGEIVRRTGRTPCSYLPEPVTAGAVFLLLSALFLSQGQNHRKKKKKS